MATVLEVKNPGKLKVVLDKDAKEQGAQIATFPESAILGWENPEAHRLAHPIPGDRRISTTSSKRSPRRASAWG